MIKKVSKSDLKGLQTHALARAVSIVKTMYGMDKLEVSYASNQQMSNTLKFVKANGVTLETLSKEPVGYTLETVLTYEDITVLDYAFKAYEKDGEELRAAFINWWNEAH